MRLFTYVVRYDFGFAPNPFDGFCTIATCKPQIRKAAQIGDWIIGTGSAQKGLAGRLVYGMRVDEALGFDAYWMDDRFARKIPSDRHSRKRAYGDNIYHRDADGGWIQADSRHSLEGGVANPGHVSTDTSVDRVLVSRTFAYFGGTAPTIPTALRSMNGPDIVHPGRGHRCVFPIETVQATVRWLASLDFGASGRPADWPSPLS